MRDFGRLLDETAKSMRVDLLTLMLADCIKLRDWSREQGEYNSAVMFGTAISHINAEITRRNSKACPT